VVPLAPAPGGARPSSSAALRHPPHGDYVLALADDPDALERAWEAGGDPAVPLVVADAGEPAAAVVREARALADLRGAVLFGATALTALEAGVPVVAGAGGAAAEAIGEDGAVVDLEDPEGAVAALRHALADGGDPGPRRARAGLFTWQGTAEATVMAYRELW
jgi:glycosyltransferase involved in cell wall biosynthesis